MKLLLKKYIILVKNYFNLLLIVNFEYILLLFIDIIFLLMSICLLSETNIQLQRGEYDIGKVQFKIYKDSLLNLQYIVIIKGEITGKTDVVTRIHSECITGDLFGSHKCDCGQQLDTAYKMLSETTQGLIIYIQGHEGRGIGLIEKIKAYNLQETRGLNTIEANIALGHEADLRNFLNINLLLELIEVKSIRIITNNPDKLRSIKCITGVINTAPILTSDNIDYIHTKINILGHNILLND
jgi:GTP cyclohydrolase II